MPRPGHLPAPLAWTGRVPALVLAAIVLAALLGAAVGPAVEARSKAPRRADQARFMWAMGTVESNHDYYARNVSSGAFGKYQIMPSNWPAWALTFLGDGQADQTPWNQEKVARGKIRGLYEWLGSWRRVAYWWLTGSDESRESRWSSIATRYVDDIMRLKKRAPHKGSPMPRRTSGLAKRGDWRRSGGGQKLRLAAAGKVWPARGRLRDGQLLRVHGTNTVNDRRWLRVVTVDGRIGWVGQVRTVPARQPTVASRWSDISDRGRDPVRRDRHMVRPQPR